MSNLKLVRFTASWCQPCKQYAPIFDEFVKETGLESEVVDIDVSTDEAQKFNISSVPTTVLVEGTDVVAEFRGVKSKPALRKWYSELQ